MTPDLKLLIIFITTLTLSITVGVPAQAQFIKYHTQLVICQAGGPYRVSTAEEIEENDYLRGMQAPQITRVIFKLFNDTRGCYYFQR